MDIQQIYIFCEVAKTGSFLAVSKKLHYAQSQISTKMQQLESSLDTNLFYRNNRGVTLTPKGEQLLIYAEKIVSLISTAESVMRDDGSASGDLKVGALEVFSQMSLPKLFSDYHKKYSLVRLSLETGPTYTLINKVLNRELDLALISGSRGGWKHPELVSLPYRTESMALVSSRSVKENPSYEDIPDHTLLVFDKECYYRVLLEQFLMEMNILPEATVEFDSASNIIANLCSGYGISFLPIALVNQSVNRDLLSLRTLPEPYASVQTYLVYRKDRYEDAAFTSFIAELMARK